MALVLASLETVKGVTDVVQNVTVSGAAVVGGLWALSRYWRQRTDEAAIQLEINASSAAHGAEHLVFIDVAVTNRGRTKIQAKSERDSNGYAYDDGVEKLYYSASLQVRRMLPGQGVGRRDLDWFENLGQGPVDGLHEVNLLGEYADPKRDEQSDFWMEPGETYHLGMPLVLPEGTYIGKVTFIASGGDDNFWSRVFCFSVPANSFAAAAARAGGAGESSANGKPD